MEEKIRTLFSLDIPQLIGVGFVVVWAGDFITKAYWFGIESMQFMFFCSLLLLVAGIGLIFKNRELVAASFVMVLVLQLPWLVDIISVLFNGKSINGSAEYVFDINKPQYLFTLRHFFMIPALAYCVSVMKGGSLRKQMLYMAAVFSFGVGAAALFAPPSEDINYTGSIAHSLIPTGSFLGDKIMFFVIVLAVMILTTYIIAFISSKGEKGSKALRLFATTYMTVGIMLSIYGYVILF